MKNVPKGTTNIASFASFVWQTVIYFYSMLILLLMMFLDELFHSNILDKLFAFKDIEYWNFFVRFD